MTLCHTVEEEKLKPIRGTCRPIESHKVDHTY